MFPEFFNIALVQFRYYFVNICARVLFFHLLYILFISVKKIMFFVVVYYVNICYSLFLFYDLYH